MSTNTPSNHNTSQHTSKVSLDASKPPLKNNQHSNISQNSTIETVAEDGGSATIKRSRLSRLINVLKPRSNVWRTTAVVSFVGLFSLAMSLAFFWRTLYLPELHQHANAIATQLRLLNESETQAANDPFAANVNDWLLERMSIELVDVNDVPSGLDNKRIASWFTRTIELQLSTALQAPVKVYFQFKPTPCLWIHYPSLGTTWVREPLNFYAEYSLELIIAWLLGIPLITTYAVLVLVRQLNRPLDKLQKAAQGFSNFGKTTVLDTFHGSTEIRQVNKAFNQMFAAIEKTNQERVLMLAGISHDLRTPLTRMRLTAEMIPDDFIREGLVYDVADMDAILQQFISYMRDGSDEELQLVNINDILQEVIMQFQPLHINYKPMPLPLIAIRPLAIKRVIMNLVGNAQRYGAEPVWISALLTSNNTIQLIVRDEGKTTFNQDISELVKPFVRGESARSTQGSGLGLAITQRIVHLHHGSLDISSPETGGFHVSITLPITQTDHPDVALDA